jgi:adenylate kinase
MTHLILLGAPGSGKGTQSARLVKDKGFVHVSTGDLLRKEIASKTDLGNEVKKVMDEGKLVSDELVVRLLKSNINLESRNYIFDGYPRNIAQAKTLDDKVLNGIKSIAVYFDINTEKLVSRLSNRRTCQTCSEIYNLLTKAPKIMGVCDKCGSKNLVQRADDKEEVIQNRLSVFAETINPVLDYYQDQNRLVRVDADLSEEEIFRQITSKV